MTAPPGAPKAQVDRDVIKETEDRPCGLRILERVHAQPSLKHFEMDKRQDDGYWGVSCEDAIEYSPARDYAAWPQLLRMHIPRNAVPHTQHTLSAYCAR